MNTVETHRSSPRLWRACLAAAVLASVVSIAAPKVTLTRYGFASATGTAPRGQHIVTGWTAGSPFSTHSDAGPQQSSVDLYAMFWARMQYADLPPAPHLQQPVPLLEGEVGFWDTYDFNVTLVGTKPPTTPYAYPTWVMVTTNDAPLPLGAVNQASNDPNWNITLPLATDRTMRVGLVCSNVFGVSMATTVLYVDQMPEPATLAFVAALGAYALLRRRTPNGQPR